MIKKFKLDFYTKFVYYSNSFIYVLFTLYSFALVIMEKKIIFIFVVFYCLILIVKTFSSFSKTHLILYEESISACYFIKKRENNLFKRLINPFVIYNGRSATKYCYFLSSFKLDYNDIKEYGFDKKGYKDGLKISNKNGKKYSISYGQFKLKDLLFVIKIIYIKIGIIPVGVDLEELESK